MQGGEWRGAPRGAIRLLSRAVSPLSDLLSRLEQVLPADRRELRARIGGLEKRLRAGKEPDPRALRVVETAIARSVASLERRAAIVPAVTYPAELPFTEALEPLRAAVESSQVVVVAGETGSGKSTQLPKLCLELGRGVRGRIAHTQPRRIAARSVARRVADELGVSLGGVVGVKVRFGDESGRDTLVKVLTDGMLLAETRGDPRLDEYDTVIVDEAHERSLNIDFLLGYLRRLLPRRPDLKVILTSATIDVERLSAHFGACPVVEIPGRMHPIDVRYRPPEVRGLDEEDPRMLAHLASAIEEIDAAFAGRGGGAPLPDVLVFLSGEREIREAAQFLEGRFRAGEGEDPGASRARETEILALFARQTIEEQERIFAPGPKRRIVLSTNVAETSLTVPRIHAVVDPGYARLLRYSAKSRVQRLPIEAISQASARQRAGRAGRLGPGIAIRLYDESDYTLRPPFTPPEILRTNLASVILQMEALHLGKAEDFPFVDPPSARLLADGRATLVELGASTVEGKLTPLGRRMSLFPLDPRLSRMLLASVEERCVNDILVVAAGLAIQDPRIRPPEKRDAADLAHARFRDGQSDFASFLRIWRAWRDDLRDEQGREAGSAAKRRWCERHHLSYPRMREWADTVGQLRELFLEHVGVKVGEPSREVDQGAFHRAVLAGFASQIGARTEKGEYRGSTGALFAVHPSSALARRGPNWIVAAEIVETTRRFARICARIQPEWIVRVAPHLCSRSQFEPHFIPETGQVAAWERTSFGELVVVPKRRVSWGPVDPVGARHVFIQEGLVAHRARTEGAFLEANRALRASIEREEARGRRRGLLLEEEAAFDFYDERVPAEIHSTPSFERWRREVETQDPKRLFMREPDLLREGADRVDPSLFPQEIAVEALELPLEYAHDPEDAGDGITVRVPVEALPLLDPAPFEWLVPGMLGEKVEALIRSLPKHLRVRLFPIEEVVQGAVEVLAFGRGALRARLAEHLTPLAQAEIAPTDFREELLAPHLRMRFSVVDADGRELGTGRDLAALAKRFASVARDRLRASVDRSSDPIALLEKERIEVLPDEPVPESIRYERAGIGLVGYPALTVERGAGRDSGDADERPVVALRVHDDPLQARLAHAVGFARLLAEEIREPVEHHVAYDAGCEELLSLLAHEGEEDGVGFIARIVAAGVAAEMPRVPRAAAEGSEAVRLAGIELHDRVAFVMRVLMAIGLALADMEARLRDIRAVREGDPNQRIAWRLGEIVGGHGLVGLEGCGRDQLSQRLRLVQMLSQRLDRLRESGAARDQAIDGEIGGLGERVRRALGERWRAPEHRIAIRSMWEEIEISRFAPKLPRAFPASERRLEDLLDS
ncbi:MAG: ATP-dependent helicase HrpA [Planctomycetota bacterium]